MNSWTFRRLIPITFSVIPPEKAEDCGTEKPAIVDILLFLCLQTGSGAEMESGDDGATPAFPNKALATRRIPGRYSTTVTFLLL